jgi:fused signal recognition particle receptor
MTIEFERRGFIERALAKTKQKISSLFGKPELTFEDLEEFLILADVPVELTEEIVEHARKNYASPKESIDYIKETLIRELEKQGSYRVPEGFSVLILVGVNGTGKTTTAIKLGNWMRKKGRKVLFAAADTFRAAGSEQLEILADRFDFPVISQSRGADPAAVVFDAVSSARAKGYDTVIADTAGRLHTKRNLMLEIEKVVRSAQKAGEGGTIQSFLIIDANTGSNAIRQAEEFGKAANAEYIIGTKLDSSAKAGSMIAASILLGKPVAFLGVGESIDDFVEFDPREFIEKLFEGI